ncbi:MAG: polysaccharide biosynthesis/export family protein [Odoribacteraceae bacterium]|jgi:polysaccharide export outer membrane protein|nr:polysaccharide biosynthesis/export family protein [Odoribacteraceae bacterium]
MTKLQFRVPTFSIILAFLLLSCGNSKQIVYFQDIDQANIAVHDVPYEAIIQPNDNLYIMVSSPSKPEAVNMFNTLNDNVSSYNLQTIAIKGYIVDNNGNINFPGLGQVHLGGLTKNAAIDSLQKKISLYVLAPVTVNVRFLNYKITVLGEVNRPGTYTVDNERITLLEALGLAGDLTIYGKRKNVLVYREVEGKLHFHRVDLTSSKLFESDYFFLQQNDLVYVQPNRARTGSSIYNQNLSVGMSLLSILVSVISILAR